MVNSDHNHINIHPPKTNNKRENKMKWNEIKQLEALIINLDRQILENADHLIILKKTFKDSETIDNLRAVIQGQYTLSSDLSDVIEDLREEAIKEEIEKCLQDAYDNISGALEQMILIGGKNDKFYKLGGMQTGIRRMMQSK